MAEVVLRSAVSDAGLSSQVEVESAGTGDWHLGQQMNSGARAALSRRGYDGSEHRARQISPPWFERLDLVLAMDGMNLQDLRRMSGEPSRVLLFGGIGGGGEVPDPYGGSLADFDRVLAQIEAAAPVIAAHLAEVLSARPA